MGQYKRKFKTPDVGECTVSNGAKQFIDGTMDTVSHIEATIQEAKERNAPQSAIDKLEDMRDINLDLVALACWLEKAQNGAKKDREVARASNIAAEKHFMEHVMGLEKINSPARLDPSEAPRDHGTVQGAPFDPRDMDVG